MTANEQGFAMVWVAIFVMLGCKDEKCFVAYFMEVKPNSVPSDGTEVENSTNVESNSVSPNDAKPIVGCSADLSTEKLYPIVLDYKNWNDEKLIQYYKQNVLEYFVNKIKSNLKNEVLSLLLLINNENNYEPEKIENMVNSIFSDIIIPKKLVLEYLDDKYKNLY